MGKDKFTLEQQNMLLQAQKIIDEASENYVETLEQHIRNLKKSLDSENLTEAYKICYLIQSQATTFGWPLATEISGWFKRLIKTQQKKGFNPKINNLFLDSFNSILQDELKEESHAAVKLLLHMETILKNEDLC